MIRLFTHHPTRQQRFVARYGPWALVSGAARGLGREFALQLAGRGLGLILLDRLGDELAQLTDQLTDQQRVPVKVLVADLARPDLLVALGPLTDGLAVGLLVCNAGQSPIGAFLQQPLASHLQLLEVNSRAALLLAHHYGQQMTARRRGGIVLLSSLSGFLGTAQATTYAATKAYNRVLAEGLWAELQPQGVDVLALAPGLTDTEGVRASEPALRSLPGRMLMSTPAVVRQALDNLGGGPTLVPGGLNGLTTALLTRLLPRRLAIGLIARNMRALYPGAARRWDRPARR